MIDIRRDGALWTLVINRPEKANSLTGAMLADLADAVTLSGQSRARVIVLTGTGPVFSAGADLDEARAGLATDRVWERLSAAIATSPCLTIAALNGTLTGGAFGMALACDLRIAVPSARFFYPVARLGFLPQPSDPVRLAALVGPSRASMILLAGARIEADEALSWGLIDRIAAPDTLETAVAALAEAALAAPEGHVAAMKAMIPLADRAGLRRGPADRPVSGG